jgi:hypothetical protein
MSIERSESILPLAVNGVTRGDLGYEGLRTYLRAISSRTKIDSLLLLKNPCVATSTKKHFSAKRDKKGVKRHIPRPHYVRSERSGTTSEYGRGILQTKIFFEMETSQKTEIKIETYKIKYNLGDQTHYYLLKAGSKEAAQKVFLKNAKAFYGCNLLLTSYGFSLFPVIVEITKF